MDNIIGTLFFIAPGFASRKIYGRLSGQGSAKSTFEETIYSLILSVYSFLILYCMGIIIFRLTGNLYLLEPENIMSSVYDIHTIIWYIVLNILSSVVTAGLWRCIQPVYMKILSRCRFGSDGDRILVTDSVLLDSFTSEEACLIEICKDGKMINRGFFCKMNLEEGEFYLEDAEEEIRILKNANHGKLIYKGSCYISKIGLLIKEIKWLNDEDM